MDPWLVLEEDIDVAVGQAADEWGDEVDFVVQRRQGWGLGGGGHSSEICPPPESVT